jgi:hypothetical protein
MANPRCTHRPSRELGLLCGHSVPVSCTASQVALWASYWPPATRPAAWPKAGRASGLRRGHQNNILINSCQRLLTGPTPRAFHTHQVDPPDVLGNKYAHVLFWYCSTTFPACCTTGQHLYDAISFVITGLSYACGEYALQERHSTPTRQSPNIYEFKLAAHFWFNRLFPADPARGPLSCQPAMSPPHPLWSRCDWDGDHPERPVIL